MESWRIRECSRERWNQILIRRLAVYDLPLGDDWSSGTVCEWRSGGGKKNLGEWVVLENC